MIFMNNRKQMKILKNFRNITKLLLVKEWLNEVKKIELPNNYLTRFNLQKNNIQMAQLK